MGNLAVVGVLFTFVCCLDRCNVRGGVALDAGFPMLTCVRKADTLVGRW